MVRFKSPLACHLRAIGPVEPLRIPTECANDADRCPLPVEQESKFPGGW